MQALRNTKLNLKFFFLGLVNKVRIINDLKFRIGVNGILANRTNYSGLNWLWDAEVKVFSQWGEDGILDYLCEKLGIIKPKILEFGAGNFTECNSRFTCEFRNADAFLVDGRKDLISNIHSSDLYWRNTIKAKSSWVTTENILELYQEARTFMLGIDILSIDYDGNDFWLMKCLPLDEVSIIIVEYNPLFGYKFPVSIPSDNAFDRSKSHYSYLYYGASISAWNLYFNGKGFKLVGTNRAGNNAFYVRAELYQKVKTMNEVTTGNLPRWRVREARNKSGKLSFISTTKQIVEISELQVVNTINGESMTVGQLHNEH